jgi:uncharacterized protein (UPF0212 family)
MAHELTDWFEEAERLRVERDALTARLREQGTMLRRLEWAVDWSRFGIASNHCPVCGNERSHGHAPDCDLAALLAALPGAAGTGGEG